VAVEELLHELGGVATRARLVRACSRAEVDRALATGAVVADARGRYTLPTAEDGLRRAHALSGTLGPLALAEAPLAGNDDMRFVRDHRRS
jgi:hypothetical protein